MSRACSAEYPLNNESETAASCASEEGSISISYNTDDAS